MFTQILGAVDHGTSLHHYNTHPEYANEFEIATAPDFNVTGILVIAIRFLSVLCNISNSAGANVTVSSSGPLLEQDRILLASFATSLEKGLVTWQIEISDLEES